MREKLHVDVAVYAIFHDKPIVMADSFICYIIDRGDQETQEKQLSLLESIDNTLSVRQFMNNGLSLQALSWKMLGSSSLKYDFSNDIKTYLESQLGVHFRHYYSRNWNTFYGKK